MKFYAGIGSRETPEKVRMAMSTLAFDLSDNGWFLRSGGASGADDAFEAGVMQNNPQMMDIYLPNSEFDLAKAKENFEKVRNYSKNESIPPISSMKPITQGLVLRNMPIILGKNLDDPVSFVVCWTKNGREVGGTRYGIRLAKLNDIPVYNYGLMADSIIREKLEERFGLALL